jgi:hypothetical protein
MKKSLYILLLILSVSCQNTDPEKKAEETPGSTQGAESAGEELNTETHTLHELASPIFKPDSGALSAAEFEVGEIASLDQVQGTPLDEKKIAPFRHLLVYNRDSTLAADLFSYSYISVEKGGKTVLTPGEPDTEIALVDLKNKTRRRLLFTGPSFIVADARWTENGKLIIIGGEQLQKEIKPVAWKIDVRKNEMESLNYPDTLSMDLASYVEQKINGVPRSGQRF